MDVSPTHELTENRLLAQLPVGAIRRLAARSEQVELQYGQILHQCGQQIADVYFPVSCLVSLLAVCNERQTLEVDVIGAEGAVGLPVVWGSLVSPSRAMVLKSGAAIRIDVAAFRQEYERDTDWQSAIDRIGCALLARSMQIAACSRYHVLEQRLARSFLLIRERLQADEFHMTHETLSQTLGVRRVGVTKAAGTLQRLKLISYNRGVIKILDAAGLERASGGAYQAVERIARGE
jgi:CRP-like cAMP-binding protein